MTTRKLTLWNRAGEVCRDETANPFSHSHAYHSYFQGYAEQRVPRENGKGTRIQRIYVADYYRYEEPDQVWRRRKLVCAGACAAAAACVLYADSRPVAMNRISAIGVAQMLTVAAMVYLLYHLVLRLAVPRVMTIGQRDETERFSQAAMLCGIGVLVVSAVMPAASMIAGNAVNLTGWVFVGLRAIGGALLVLLAFKEKHRTLTRIPNENQTPTGANEIW